MSDFDSYAHDYEAALDCGIAVSGENAEFFARGRIAWLARCLERMRSTPKTVLDYGCGTGTATPLFIELLGVSSVIGVDVSAKSLEIARQNKNNLPVEYHSIDEYTPRAEVDLAFCNGVFHHVPPGDRMMAARYLADCLRPAGVLAFWENNPWSPAARFVMSRIPFDRDAVMVWPKTATVLLKSVNLQPIRTDYFFLFPRSLRALRFVEPALSRLPLGAQYQVLAQKPGGA